MIPPSSRYPTNIFFHIRHTSFYFFFSSSTHIFFRITFRPPAEERERILGGGVHFNEGIACIADGAESIWDIGEHTGGLLGLRGIRIEGGAGRAGEVARERGGRDGARRLNESDGGVIENDEHSLRDNKVMQTSISTFSSVRHVTVGSPPRRPASRIFWSPPWRLKMSVLGHPGW